MAKNGLFFDGFSRVFFSQNGTFLLPHPIFSKKCAVAVSRKVPKLHEKYFFSQICKMAKFTFFSKKIKKVENL